MNKELVWVIFSAIFYGVVTFNAGFQIGRNHEAWQRQDFDKFCLSCGQVTLRLIPSGVPDFVCLDQELAAREIKGR